MPSSARREGYGEFRGGTGLRRRATGTEAELIVKSVYRRGNHQSPGEVMRKRNSFMQGSDWSVRRGA